MSKLQPWIKLLLIQALQDITPSLNLRKFDKRVAQICNEDFNHYVEYLSEVDALKSLLICEPSVEVEINHNTGEFKIVNSDDEIKEATEFVTTWAKMWWKKWKERVQLIFGKSKQQIYDRSVETQKKGSKVLWNLSKEEKEGILKATRNVLIKRGEICCSQIIAKSLLNATLSKIKIKKWDQQEKINLMAGMMRDAKHMTYSHGPLVFVKLDKNYYRLREFRDSNNNVVKI